MENQKVTKVFRSRISELLLGFMLAMLISCTVGTSCVGSCVCTCKGEIKAYRRISKKECVAKTNVEKDCKCVYE